MLIRSIISGIASHIYFLSKLRGTQGTTTSIRTARYCYSVWLRHLAFAYKNIETFKNILPQLNSVAEIGPGDSLGSGIAALLSGVNNYYAFDVVKHENRDRSLEMFDELIELFSKRENIPGEKEFPKVKPFLESYDFPSDLITEERLKYSLHTDRVKAIKYLLTSDNSINNSTAESNNNVCIKYIVPWNSNILEEESVEMIFSQSVLELVYDINAAYEAMYLWLKPGGFISHQIDFKCLGTAEKWNGHWSYSDLMWKIIKGKKPYFPNRLPCSVHIENIERSGFKVIDVAKIKDYTGIRRDELAPYFRGISEDDFTTSGALILAQKK